VLFLDIEGTFPNTVPARLMHNMRKRGVPRKIVSFIHNMLRGQSTALKFDGYMLNPIVIDNRIGQGDLLSMVMYQYYNADLLDIPREEGETAIVYMDDLLMAAMANSFEEAHEKLVSMMTREGGVDDWSTAHNFPLEYSKLALINFAHQCSAKTRTPLILPRQTVEPAVSTKYLGGSLLTRIYAGRHSMCM
jgi:Reverse transcriptase (RNA-dependent DNA polymerase)